MATTALTTLNLPTQAAPLFASSIDLSSLDGTTGFRLNGGGVSQYSGVSVSSAGDINGDGFSDFLVGAPFQDDVDARGRAYVVFGTATARPAVTNLSTLNGTNGFRLLGIGFDSAGYSIAAAGDVNGDGLADLIVGAPYSGANGSAYVLFGSRSGFAGTINASSLSGATGFRLIGAASGDRAGSAVSGAGDVNGDGIADLVVGAPGASDSGAAFVVFGKTAAYTSPLNLSTLDGTNGFRVNGSILGEDAGASVGAGDINGDGKSDILIGAPGDLDTAVIAGGAYVVLGKSTGFASAIELSALTGSDGFRLNGMAVGDATGKSVSASGDVNGDGFADMVIGAPASDPGGLLSAGRAFVVRGKAEAFASSVNLSALNGTTGFRLNGSAAGSLTGWSVSNAGDINGDGYADVIAGAPTAQTAGSLSGSSFVLFGKSGAYLANIPVTTLNGATGFRLQGEISSLSGYGVNGAGDINSDGFVDLAIGAPAASPGFTAAGSTFVLHGREPVAAVIRTGGSAHQYISGGPGADKLSGRGGNDILEGRGGADVIDGSTGSDTASYEHAALGVVASLPNPGTNTNEAAGDTYNIVENLRGSAFADRLYGTNYPNTLEGLAGDDFLKGSSGVDKLNGGAGDDTLSGGYSNDIFIYSLTTDSTVANPDGITDFAAGSPTTYADRIDLSRIDANSALSGNQAFSFVGTAPFTLGTPGQVRVSLSGGHAFVTGDVNGDQTADFSIELVNVTSTANLDATDFLP